VRLVIPPGVLKPPTDSLLLADQLRQEAFKQDARVLDLCSGSGILAIVAAQRGASRVTAVDISRRAVLATRLNAKLNGVQVSAVRGDLFYAVPGQRFDLIASNPPYLPSASAELPEGGAHRAWDAGPRGRAFLDRICAEAERHLRPGGVLLLVHSSLCDEGQTVDELSRRGYEVEIAQRHRGPLGPLMHARAQMLRERGLLPDGEVEDIVVVRARRLAGATNG
jgi:release factor glutamine methyltransferase